MIYTKFQLNLTSGSGEVKNRFSRWLPWPPYWISNQDNLYKIWSTSCPNAPYRISAQSDQQFWRKKLKIDFQDGRHSSHIGYRKRHDLYKLWPARCTDTPHQVRSIKRFGRSQKCTKSNGQTDRQTDRWTDIRTTGNMPRHKLSLAYRPRWANNSTNQEVNI